MKFEKIFSTSMIVLCMGIIFLFSNQNGHHSEALSDGITVKVIEVYEQFRGKEFSLEVKNKLVKEFHFLIRKGAHLFLYFLLGFFAYFTLKSYRFKYPFIGAICFTLLYASGDEIHQLFVQDRTGKVRDVFIDMSGAFLGILLSRMVFDFSVYKKKKKKILRSEKLKKLQSSETSG